MRSSDRLGSAPAEQLASSAARAPSTPSRRASSRRPVSQLPRIISHAARRRSARSASAGGHAFAGIWLIAVMQSAPLRSACARSARYSSSCGSTSGCRDCHSRATSAWAVRLPVADLVVWCCGGAGGSAGGATAGGGSPGTGGGSVAAGGGAAGFGASLVTDERTSAAAAATTASTQRRARHDQRADALPIARALQRRQQRVHRQVASRRIGRQPGRQHAIDRARHPVGAGRRWPGAHRRGDVGGGLAAERPAPVQRLVQRHAERKLIRQQIAGLAVVQLGRHVRGRSQHRAGLGQRRPGRLVAARWPRSSRSVRPDRSRRIGTRPLRRDQDVLGFDVAVDHVQQLCSGQPASDLQVEVDNLPAGRGRMPFGDPARHRPAVDQLGDHVESRGRRAPTSWTVSTLGCDRDARSWASRRKRARGGRPPSASRCRASA